ncbi:MAG: UDP-2,3-diacylglucosamine diphosphatase [Planctomycetota bacterium]
MTSFPNQNQRRRYRAVWISDTHLGTRSCKADFLLDFLKSIETDHLYLVGDIIDLWKAKSGWYWNDIQNQVLRRVLKMSSLGTKVFYTPGNHDEYFRGFIGTNFGGIQIIDRVEHRMLDGRRFLVFHGDQFDAIVCNYRWLAVVGGHLYDWLVQLNSGFNWCRKKLGMHYWSLSQYLKLRAKHATKVIGSFETITSEFGKKEGYDGVVCGHIHKAEIRDINGITYCNDGDWVESCTALVEHLDGRLEIIEWTDRRPEVPVEEPQVEPTQVASAV